MLQSFSRRCIFCLLAPVALGLSAGGAESAAPGAWLAGGWGFRLPVAVAAKAESLELVFEHSGLMQSDGRDVRVIGPDGQPVSHLLSSLDSARCRLLFDGASGAGTYFVYLGNPDPQLPPPAAGITAIGRKEWKPAGGFSSISYDPEGFDLAAAMIDRESAIKVTKEIAAKAETAQKTDDAQPKTPGKPRAFVVRGVWADSMPNLPQRWVHQLRFDIQIPVAGKYDFVMDGPAQEYRVVFVDGKYDRAVIPGWYGTGGQHRGMVSDWMGDADVAAGRHVIEIFTNSPRPQLRLGLTGTAQKAMPLTGAQAVYEATRVQAGDLAAADGDLAKAMLAAAADWLQRRNFLNARLVCQAGSARFAAQAEIVAGFRACAAKAEVAAYTVDWLTEGGNAARTGFVDDTGFLPPLQVVSVGLPRQPHDEAWTSSCIILGDKLLYGLPFDVQDTPWGVTGAACAADGVLYVGTKNAIMQAVDLTTGALKWSFPCGGPCVGCPLLYRDVLYFGTLDRRLYALDPATGRMLWNFPAKGWIEGSPCAADGRLFFGARDGFLYALDARLGVERWKFQVGSAVSGTPITDGGLVFVGSRGGRFVAIDAATGALRWEYAAGAAIQGGACVADGRVIFGDAAGNVHALNTDTGKIAWAKPVAVGGPVTAAPLQVGRVIYGGTMTGLLWGLDAETGALGWRAGEESSKDTGGISRPPAYANGRLVFCPIGSPGRVFECRPAALPPQRCFTAPGAIAVDGKLDEPAWQACPRWPGLYRRTGLQDADPVTVKTLWDKDRLYLAVTVQDADPQPEDVVVVVLDPQGDGLAAGVFSVKLTGEQLSDLVTDLGPNTIDPKAPEKLAALKLPTPADFKPQWRSAVTQQPAASGTPQSWTAEIAIPFDQLPATFAPRPTANRHWGINVLVKQMKVSTQEPGAGRPVLKECWGLCPQGEGAGSFGPRRRWPDLVFDATPPKP